MPIWHRSSKAANVALKPDYKKRKHHPSVNNLDGISTNNRRVFNHWRPSKTDDTLSPT
ncbi:MAG: hypothetical protein ACYTXA_33275 [Nostoc sp.]